MQLSYSNQTSPTFCTLHSTESNLRITPSDPSALQFLESAEPHPTFLYLHVLLCKRERQPLIVRDISPSVHVGEIKNLQFVLL